MFITLVIISILLGFIFEEPGVLVVIFFWIWWNLAETAVPIVPAAPKPQVIKETKSPKEICETKELVWSEELNECF